MRADGDAYVVTFVHVADEARAVLLFVNRMTDESDLASSLMEQVRPGTWALSLRVAPDWRASYCFVEHSDDGPAPWQVGGQTVLRDVLDHGLPGEGLDQVLNRSGRPMSVVSMPAAPAQPWLGSPGAPRPPRHVIAGREIWMHRAGEGASLPVVIVLDGEVWLDHHGLPEALDAAVSAGAVPAHVAVFVATGTIADRWADVGHPGGVTSFVGGDLVDWLRAQDLATAPDRTVVAGQSLGGLSALWAVARHRDRVGVAIAQSASLWRSDPAPELAQSRARVLLEVGLQEWTLLPLHRELAQQVPGVELHEFNGGHDYACWRGGLVDAIVRALG